PRRRGCPLGMRRTYECVRAARHQTISGSIDLALRWASIQPSRRSERNCSRLVDDFQLQVEWTIQVIHLGARRPPLAVHRAEKTLRVGGNCDLDPVHEPRRGVAREYA